MKTKAVQQKKKTTYCNYCSEPISGAHSRTARFKLASGQRIGIEICALCAKLLDFDEDLGSMLVTPMGCHDCRKKVSFSEIRLVMVPGGKHYLPAARWLCDKCRQKHPALAEEVFDLSPTRECAVCKSTVETAESRRLKCITEYARQLPVSVCPKCFDQYADDWGAAEISYEAKSRGGKSENQKQKSRFRGTKSRKHRI